MATADHFEFIRKHFFVDISKSEEIDCIKKAVDEFMEKIRLAMNKGMKGARNISKIIPTGSMAENSKVWPLWQGHDSPELEFDYLAVLDESTYYTFHKSKCEGFMEINDKEEKRVSRTDITTHFSNSVFDALSNIGITCHEYRYLPFDMDPDQTIKEIVCSLSKQHDDHNGCSIKKTCGRLMFVKYAPFYGNEIHFIWYSTKNTIRIPYIADNNEIRECDDVKKVSVVVDFLPGLKASLNTSVYLVPKGCDISIHENCWKISHCLCEIETIQKSHRETYMALKLLFYLMLCPNVKDEWLSVSSLASYRIKTAVINHTKQCKTETSYLCVGEILDVLSTCIFQRKIDHWKENYSLQILHVDNKSLSAVVSYIADLLCTSRTSFNANEKKATQRRDELLEGIFGKVLSSAISRVYSIPSLEDYRKYKENDNSSFKDFEDIRSAALLLQKSNWGSPELYLQITDQQLPIIYTPEYNIGITGLGPFLSFDAGKWERVYRYLQEATLVDEKKVVKPKEATERDLTMVHSKQYISEKIVSSRVAVVSPRVTRGNTGIGSLLGFVSNVYPNFIWQRNVLRNFRYHTGGTILAGKLAMERGWAINIGGGFHHAEVGFSGYADISISLKFLFERVDGVAKAMIIDLDAHQGIGYEHEFMGDERVYIIDVYNKHIEPRDEYAKVAIKKKVELNDEKEDVDYLPLVENNVKDALSEFSPDIVIYNAGSDILKGDPCGRLSISDKGLIDRDEIVFRNVTSKKIPIVMVVGGCYQTRAARVIANSIINLREKKLINCLVPEISNVSGTMSSSTSGQSGGKFSETNDLDANDTFLDMDDINDT